MQGDHPSPFARWRPTTKSTFPSPPLDSIPGERRMSSHQFDPALTWLRWTIQATMLLITLAWPVPGRGGHQLWPYVLAFIGYNLAIEAVRWRVPRLRTYSWVPLLDLPTASLLYFLDAEPGGPLFVSFYLAVVTAATYWPVRATMVYTLAIAGVVVVIAPTLPEWSATAGNLRQLAARMVVLLMIGAGTAVMARRVARQAEVASLMREEAMRLEEHDRLRSDFVGSISHELRTPLTAIRAGIGLLDLSASDRLQEEERRLLTNARRNTERLSLLIDDLLASGQIETGTLRLEQEPLDLRVVVSNAMAVMHPLVQQRDQVLEMDLPEPLPIEGDARRLEQVLVNLLANANVHTPSGTRIAISGEVASEGVRLRVRDNGPGIPISELEAVFGRFHRLDMATGGSGLGLTIARSIVELHDGRIWAERMPEGGTSFTIELPRRADGGVP